MFCTKCGASIYTHDRFCAKCGAPNNSTQATTAVIPTFGTPVYRGWGPFRAKNAYPSGYEWVSQRNTLLMCKDHIVLINGDEKRSGAMDIISAMGLIGGIFRIIRAAKDDIANKKFDLTPALTEVLFDKRQLIWCKKCDAEIWRYELKPWMFIKKNSDQLYCRFNSMAGTIHCCLVFVEAEFPDGFRSDINPIKIVVVERNVPEMESEKIMETSRLRRLPD